MADEGKQDWIYGTVLVLVLLVVGFNLILDYGRGVDLTYVSFFILLLGFGILAAIILGVVSLGLDGDGYKPNIVDSSDVRMLADKPWSRTVAAIILFAIFFGGGLASQSSIIPIVNPYDASSLIAKGSTLSTDHSKIATALRSGIYPGFGEDVAGFLLTSITTFLLLLFFKRFDEDAFSEKLLFLLAAIVSCVLWGFVFASAHALAYGSNAPAFIFAWLYGSVSQFVNQLVGAPVSILAHIAHNVVIVASLSVAVCVGSLCSGFLFLPRGLFMKRARKGNAMVTAGISMAVILAVIGGLWFMAGYVNRDSFHCPGASLHHDSLGQPFCASDAVSGHFQGTVDFSQSTIVPVTQIIGQPDRKKTSPGNCVLETTEILSVTNLQQLAASAHEPPPQYIPVSGSVLMGIPAQILVNQKGTYQLSFDYTYRTDYALWDGKQERHDDCIREVTAAGGLVS